MLINAVTWYSLAIVALFVLYVIGMRMKWRHENGKMEWYHWIWAVPTFIVGVPLNVFLNITLLTVIYWELPQEWTMSKRFNRHADDEGDWREKLAYIVCSRILNKYDPCHCENVDEVDLGIHREVKEQIEREGTTPLSDVKKSRK